jgi:hypothetical protein
VGAFLFHGDSGQDDDGVAVRLAASV